MAVIHDLLKRVADAELRARLEEEIGRLTKHKKFGLVFEEHLPECTPLYDVKIKRGMTVATKQADCGALFIVKSIKDGVAGCVPVGEGDVASFKVDELVAVARFGDPIYPCLKKLDSIDNGGGDLWHTLIQADNYHALQLLGRPRALPNMLRMRIASVAFKSFARFVRREVSSDSFVWILARARYARRSLRRVMMMTCAPCLICMDSRKDLP